MADAVARIIADRDLRARLSSGARTLTEREYSPAGFAAALAREWRAVWNEDVQA
jgi:glycosyltransferase involved in cell wall biosynthesis